MKKVIHVNRQNIAMNRKDGGNRPTLTCKTYKENYKGVDVHILGPSRIFDAIACGRNPLSCGARVWIETTSPVLVDGRHIE